MAKNLSITLEKLMQRFNECVDRGMRPPVIASAISPNGSHLVLPRACNPLGDAHTEPAGSKLLMTIIILDQNNEMICFQVPATDALDAAEHTLATETQLKPPVCSFMHRPCRRFWALAHRLESVFLGPSGPHSEWSTALTLCGAPGPAGPVVSGSAAFSQDRKASKTQSPAEAGLRKSATRPAGVRPAAEKTYAANFGSVERHKSPSA
jgi:hypothetical protein